MSFRWLYLDDEGGETGGSEAFDSLQAAEEFMGARWEALLSSGVRRVALVSDGKTLYRMWLTPDAPA